MKTKGSTQNSEIAVSLLRKSKKEYYNTLNVKNIADKKNVLQNSKTFSIG